MPFLDGGTHVIAKYLILILPFPIFLFSLVFDGFQLRKLPSFLVFSWLVFLFFAGLSVLNSTSKILSIPAFAQLIGMFLFLAIFFLSAEKENFKYVVGVIIIISIFLCLLSFYYLLPWVKKPEEMNLIFATYNHNHLADYLLLVIPFVLAFFLTAEKRLKTFFGLLLVFYLLSFILTFSRGALLALIPIVILLIFLLKPDNLGEKTLSWLFILIPAGIFLLILIYSNIPLGIKAKSIQPNHWLVKQLVKQEFQAKRFNYWLQGIKGFMARPWFGFGWGTFEIISLRFQKGPGDWSRFAHNFYLQVLCEGGIFTFLAFFGFLGWSFWQIYSQIKIKKDPFLFGGVGAIFASSLHSFFDYDWHFPAVFLTFLFILANLFLLAENPAFGEDEGNKKTFQKLKKLKTTLHWCLLFLSFLTFIFGLSQVLGEYFLQKGNYQIALTFSPWPSDKVEQLGDKIFEKDFAQGEKIGQKILSISSQDPSIYYWLADKYYSFGKLEKAAPLYQKTIEYNPLENCFLYRRLGGIYEKLGEKNKRDFLYQYFAKKLESSNLKENNALAKEFYFLGEDYLKEKEIEKAIFWWKKSISTSPQWSYFHIDLANLYFKLGKQSETKDVLSNCLNYYYPKENCQEYLKRFSKGESLDPPGYWREKILSIPE